MEENEHTIYILQWTDGEKTKNHGLYRSIDDATNAIYDWWNLNSYKPPYVRMWYQGADRCYVIDYGFHTMFYNITEVNKESFPHIMFEEGE